MSKTIYKYSLFPISLDTTVIDMPAGAELLHVDGQNEYICIWALVDPQADPTARKFRVFGTGHPIESSNLQHVGSALMFDGTLVSHVFEEVGP